MAERERHAHVDHISKCQKGLLARLFVEHGMRLGLQRQNCLTVDGAVEIVLAHTEPDSLGDRANWLPVPEGDFVLLLRLYLPRDEVVDGDYPLPRIERIR